MQRATLLALLVSISSVLLNGVDGSQQLTQAIYQEAHYNPILVYECFRTGTSIGPPDAVNRAYLYDMTQHSSYYGSGSTWYSRRSNPGRVYKVPMQTHYDPQRGVGHTHFPNVDVYSDVVATSPNGMGIFYKLMIPSQNRVVYKVYDQNKNCQNARALLSSVCPQCQMQYTRIDTSGGFQML